MRPLVSLLVLCALLAGSAAGTVQERREPTSPARVDKLEAARSRGALLFRIHCAPCHGLEGRGDGPVRKALRVAPTDLTDLMEVDKAGEAVFPAARIRSVVDGRKEVRLRGHGTREMPIWGLTFQDRVRPDDQERPAREAIDDLLEYLRTLQTPLKATSGTRRRD